MYISLTICIVANFKLKQLEIYQKVGVKVYCLNIGL